MLAQKKIVPRTQALSSAVFQFQRRRSRSLGLSSRLASAAGALSGVDAGIVLSDCSLDIGDGHMLWRVLRRRNRICRNIGASQQAIFVRLIDLLEDALPRKLA